MSSKIRLYSFALYTSEFLKQPFQQVKFGAQDRAERKCSSQRERMGERNQRPKILKDRERKRAHHRASDRAEREPVKRPLTTVVAVTADVADRSRSSTLRPEPRPPNLARIRNPAPRAPEGRVPRRERLISEKEPDPLPLSSSLSPPLIGFGSEPLTSSSFAGGYSQLNHRRINFRRCLPFNDNEAASFDLASGITGR